METDSSAASVSSSVGTGDSSLGTAPTGAVTTSTAADSEAPQSAVDESSAGREDGSTNDGTEATQSQSNDPVERRIRGIQSAKDKEIAEVKQQHEATQARAKELESAFSQLEQMVLANQYQQVLTNQGQDAATAMVERFKMAKAAQALQQQEAALKQRESLLESRGAKALAYDLAADPKYKGVDPEALMRYSKFGAEAMMAAAEDLAMSQRKTAITERKASGADRVGSQGGSSQSEPRFGADAIASAYSRSNAKKR